MTASSSSVGPHAGQVYVTGAISQKKDIEIDPGTTLGTSCLDHEFFA